MINEPFPLQVVPCTSDRFLEANNTPANHMQIEHLQDNNISCDEKLRTTDKQEVEKTNEQEVEGGDTEKRNIPSGVATSGWLCADKILWYWLRKVADPRGDEISFPSKNRNTLLWRSTI